MSGNGHTFSGGQSIGKTQGTAPLTLSLSGFPNFGLENLDGIQNHYQPVRFEQIAPNFVSKHVRTFCDELCREHLSRRKTDLPMGNRRSVGHRNSLSDSAKAGLASDLSPPDLPPLKPLAREGFGVVVMADVSGYSKLTSMLAERGPMGAELLSKTMKGYLDQIIQTVLTHGGDIVKFAGDAVIVYWKIEGPCDGTNISPNDPVSIARGELVVKACYCCLDMLKKLGRYKINIPGCEIEDLQIHLGIGSGQLYDVHVGMTDRWEHFIAGEAVNQLNHVLNAAKPGELAISHQAFKWFSLVIDIETITLGAYNKKYILLNGLEKAQRKIPPSTPTENDDLALWEIASADLNVCLYQKFMNESALYKLQADINQSRLFRIESGLNELLSLYELRQVTTVFIRIGSLQNWNGKTSLADAQQAMAIAQTALKKYEGSLRQFHVDDKGAVMLLFFGLPPLAHENDAIMGLKTGLEICQQYSFLFSEFSIGITTGVISIGGVGNSVRTEYALMGDSINMAARLMFLDAASESILCDERTYNLTERAFVFDSLGEVKVKGKDHPISIFRPKEIRQEAEESNRRFAHDDQLEMIGRSKEKSTVIDAISSVKSGGSEAASIVVIETEGGQGLSTFVKWSKQEIKKRKCLACCGTATEVGKAVPFFVFGGIVRDLTAILCSSEVLIAQNTISADEAVTSSDPTQTTTDSIAESSVDSPAVRPDFRKRLLPNTGSSSSIDVRGSPNIPLLKAFRRINDNSRNSLSTNIIGSDGSDENEREEQRPRLESKGSIVDNISASQRFQSDYFQSRLQDILRSCGEDPMQAILFNQIFPSEFSDIEPMIPQIQAKMRMNELSELLKRLLVKLSVVGTTVLVIHEAQWMDMASWELIWNILEGCPMISIFFYSRPDRNYDNEDTRNQFLKLKRLPRTAHRIMQGLSMEETKAMVISCWSGFRLKNVTQTIVENIFKRTGGNPLFIRSLVVALKESGQWRVGNNGELTTNSTNFDFEQIVFGYDLQSIIIAQFDRLDRNYQLFLKIASVLGQRFLADDVLHFISDMPRFADTFDTRSNNSMIKSIEGLDKYGFLIKADIEIDGLYFQFKSAVVRKCIYHMMVQSQRQQLHLNIASYYEKLLNESNRHKLLIPLYEHYVEAGSQQRLKKLRYLEAVSHYYYEKHAMNDAIKHYSLLLETLAEIEKETGLTLYNNVTLATWHREVGEAHILRDEWEKSEFHLLQSLKLVNHEFPTDSLWMRFRIYKALARCMHTYVETGSDAVSSDGMWGGPSGPNGRSRSKNLYFARPGSRVNSMIGPLKRESVVAVGATVSVADTHIVPRLTKRPSRHTRDSEMVRNAIVKGTPAAALNIAREVLTILGQLYFRGEKFRQYQYAVLTGLNLCTQFPKDIVYGQLLAQVAFIYWIRDRRKVLTLRHLEAADFSDSHTNIYSTSQISSHVAITLFIMGLWEPAINRSEYLYELGLITGDMMAREGSLRIRGLIYYYQGPRHLSSSLSRDLYAISNQEEYWIGKFWGCVLIISNLLSQYGSNEELQDIISSFQSVWNTGPEFWTSSAVLQIIRFGILTEADIRFGVGFSPVSTAKEIERLVSQLKPHDWSAVHGIIHILNAFFSAYDNGSINDSASKRSVEKVCAMVERALKRMKAMVLADMLRQLWKGFRCLCGGKTGLAVAAWKKALQQKDSEMVGYYQAQLHWKLSKYSVTDKNYEISYHSEEARRLFRKIGAVYELEKIALN